MTKTPWVRFFPSDWLAGTRGLTASEAGIYITLIALMYERDGRVANEPSRLSRLCGASNSAFKRALQTLLEEGKIEEEDGLLFNNRVVEELFYSREKSSVASKNAKSRWAQKTNKNKADNDAGAMPPQCNGNASRARSRTRTREDISEPNGSLVGLPKKQADPQPVQKAFQNYNITASELGLPIAKALTADRKRKLHARLKEHGLSGWNDALVQIEQSSFLRGQGEKGWCASIDFLLQPSSFNKVLEGAYADERERA